MPYYISEDYMFFPHPLLSDDEGFLAMCDDLSVERILLAYQFGIFPWYIEGQPMWWFYTHPRCVLIPSEVKVTKSMRPYFNQNKFDTRFDTAFDEVISNCQTIKRKGQSGTWLIEDLKKSMLQLHEMGYAHSIEVWQDEELVGGLYGIALGKIFFGESMFAKVSNASKFALIKLCQYLDKQGYELIDCQQITDHIMRLGAQIMSKDQFYSEIRKNLLHPTIPVKWVYPGD